MMKSSLLRSAAVLSALLLLLAGCGGGGGGGDGGGGGGGSRIGGREFIQPTTPLGSSYQYSEAAGAGCSPDTQKKFVRTYLDEVYLWYNEIVDVKPEDYATVPDYFYALLVRTPDANGLPKDRFSAVLPASQASDLTRQYAVQQAATALMKDAGTVLKTHTNTVPVTNVVASAGGRSVGYILFNAHDTGAQDDLIPAFQQLQAAGVQDLILDLRNNSGGYLYIALAAASMITGPAAEGQVFEQLRYNDKRPALTQSSTLRFSSRLQYQETRYPVGTQLPQLGLPRVFILTTGSTCSASESIINSLRGIGVQVIRIGTTTCGKPYGFTQKNNCGYAYFPIEFQGTNAQGFGDYTTGFQPTCNIAQPADTQPASATDPLYNGALYYIDNNACPAGTATGVQSAATPLLAPVEKPNRPSWAGRLLLPEQQTAR